MEHAEKPNALERMMERARTVDLDSLGERTYERARAFDWDDIGERTRSVYHAGIHGRPAQEQLVDVEEYKWEKRSGSSTAVSDGGNCTFPPESADGDGQLDEGNDE
ncbi:MAG TPA: hypothetical protein VE134_10265 [Methanomicrobiales archaeon]|nr:hypothetical protein [Methanomicrobiales archaeon]